MSSQILQGDFTIVGLQWSNSPCKSPISHFHLYLVNSLQAQSTAGTHNSEYVSYVGAIIAHFLPIYGADFHADRQLAQFSN